MLSNGATDFTERPKNMAPLICLENGWINGGGNILLAVRLRNDLMGFDKDGSGKDVCTREFS